MIACILFMVGTTNFITPGCHQGTGIVTPTEIVHVVKVPKAYAKQVAPYYQKVIKFEDTLVFHGEQQFRNYQYHYNLAKKQPASKRYAGFSKWIDKRLKKRYRFHLNLRVRGVRSYR